MTNPISLSEYMSGLADAAQRSSDQLRLASHEDRNEALHAIADAIVFHSDPILAANDKDYAAAKDKGLTGAMLDRLKLDHERLQAVAQSVRSIADMDDPIGAVDEHWQQPNGLVFDRVRIPIGVIGMIYESRPNVTVDAAALCLKSGNACILRGGSESYHSNQALYTAICDGIASSPLSENPVQLVNTTDREAVGLMLGGLNGRVDMIIPRGGKSLVARVQKDARVPVLSHLDGLCHTYVHRAADPQKAQDIVINAKMRRTGICGATETLLIDQSIAADSLPGIISKLGALGCEIRGDNTVIDLIGSGVSPATTDDFRTEHLAAILNVKIVDGLDHALAHISEFGSGHTDAIITEDQDAAERFLRDVDSAIVIHNASTQFADGGEFGFGAEIGIATGRMHARGPVGAKHLTTYKYAVRGTGQTRP